MALGLISETEMIAPLFNSHLRTLKFCGFAKPFYVAIDGGKFR